jgi:hypothetical protein
MFSRRKLLSSGTIMTLLGVLPRRVWSSLAFDPVGPLTDVRHGRMQVRLQCEYRDNPAGIDVLKPRLFWQLQSSRRGERQTAYRILVASERSLLAQAKANLWDSGRVLSDQTVQIEYAGVPLGSRQSSKSSPEGITSLRISQDESVGKRQVMRLKLPRTLSCFRRG